MIDTVILRIKQFDFQITNYVAFTPNCLGFFAHPYIPFNGQTHLKSVQNPSKWDRDNQNYKPRLTVLKRMGRKSGFEVEGGRLVEVHLPSRKPIKRPHNS